MTVYEFYISLFRYQKKYPSILSASLTCLIVTSICECLLPVIVKLLFDYLSGIGHIQNLWVILALLALNYIVLLVGSVIGRNVQTRLGVNIIRDLRFLILEKIQSKPDSKIKNEHGQILTNSTTSLTTLESTLFFTLWKYANLLLVIVISGMTLIYFEWHMSLIVFVCMAALYKIPNFFSEKAAFYFSQKRKSEWALVDHIQEEMTLKKVIRIFLLTKYRQDLFETLLNKAKKLDFGYGSNLAMVGSSAFLSTYFVRILILIVGLFLVGSQHLTLIELTAFYLALGNLSAAISSLSSNHASIAQGATSLNQIEQMLAEPDVTDDQKRQIIAPPFSKNIVFKNVFFKYQENYVLSNINLEISAGQSVAFVGQSGSGKSTLLSLLLCDNKVSKGEILIDGINLDTIYLPSLFKQIGVIYQNSLLFNTTIENNIRMGKQTATQEDIISAAQRAELHHDLSNSQLSYDTPVGEQNQSLSGGQCQRIAIARALISNPALLYLDEATSALDPTNSEAIDRTLDKMAGNCTIISVTHRLKSAVNADQIIVLDKGEIAERGTHQELLAKQGLYSTLWEKQHGVTLSPDKKEGTVNPLWLKFVPLFDTFSPEALQLIGNEFEIETVEENKEIFNEGDQGNKFYVIAAGMVSVSRRNKETNQDEQISTLADGDFFGEIALLDEVPRTASVTTLSVCIFMTLTSRRFHKVLAQLPDGIKRALVEKAAARKNTEYL